MDFSSSESSVRLVACLAALPALPLSENWTWDPSKAAAPFPPSPYSSLPPYLLPHLSLTSSSPMKTSWSSRRISAKSFFLVCGDVAFMGWRHTAQDFIAARWGNFSATPPAIVLLYSFFCIKIPVHHIT